jgi:hypothetical protein
MSGTICVPAGDLARYTAFTVALACMNKPDDAFLSVFTSMSVVDNMNAIVSDISENNPDNEWIWILGDDHYWEPDLLLSLLATKEEYDCDILVPLCCRRNPPWDLVLMREQVGVDEHGYAKWQPYNYSEIPEEPFEVEAAGSAGMLVDQKVLDALGEPWFYSTAGSMVNEDVEFCRRAREAGFQVWCDPRLSMGHIGIFQVMPVRNEDGVLGPNTQFSSADPKYRSLFFPRGANV